METGGSNKRTQRLRGEKGTWRGMKTEKGRKVEFAMEEDEEPCKEGKNCKKKGKQNKR